MFFRVIFCYTQQLFDWKYIFLGAGFGLFIGWQGAGVALSFGSSPTWWDATVLALAGPNPSVLTLRDFLGWFVVHLYALFLTSRFLQESLYKRNTIVVPRIESRRRWYLSYLLFFVLFSNLYTLAMIVFTAIGAMLNLRQSGTDEQFLSAVLMFDPNVFSVQSLIVWVYVLISGTLLVLTTIQLLFASLLTRVIYSFIGIVFLCLIAWLSMHSGFLQMIIPATQSMFIRHAPFNIENPDFTFEWSLLYNSVVALTVAGLGMWLIRKVDIFGDQQIGP